MLNKNLRNCKEFFDSLKVQEQDIALELASLEAQLSVSKQAYQIVKQASLLTLDSLKEYIEQIINESLEYLYPEEAFRLTLEYKEVRGKAAVTFNLSSAGKPVDLYSAGGGLLNWISLIFQLILINLDKSKFLVADESLANLSEDKQDLAAIILSKLAEQLDIQIIMVTHSTAFADNTEGGIKLWSRSEI